MSKQNEAMKQAIIEEASIQMTGHPSKDARWFAKSVYEYFMAEQPAPSCPDCVFGVCHCGQKMQSKTSETHADIGVERGQMLKLPVKTYSGGKAWHVAPEPEQQEPEIVQRVKRYAGKTLRDARNPNITARECIELADWLVAHGITKDQK